MESVTSQLEKHIQFSPRIVCTGLSISMYYKARDDFKEALLTLQRICTKEKTLAGVAKTLQPETFNYTEEQTFEFNHGSIVLTVYSVDNGLHLSPYIDFWDDDRLFKDIPIVLGGYVPLT